MPKLTNPRISRYADSISSTWWRKSGVNFNEPVEGVETLRIDIDFYVDEAAFIAKHQPLDSKAFEVPALPAVDNALNASLLANHTELK